MWWTGHPPVSAPPAEALGNDPTPQKESVEEEERKRRGNHRPEGPGLVDLGLGSHL
jgi:hypothetical protein